MNLSNLDVYLYEICWLLKKKGTNLKYPINWIFINWLLKKKKDKFKISYETTFSGSLADNLYDPCFSGGGE